MAVWGLEWIIVAVIVIVLFLWGPEKIPKIARAFGQAKREFERASKEPEKYLQQYDVPSQGAQTAKTQQEDKLLEIATSLGISTEGKTREQIAQEISRKLQETK